jgi:hypothetical protein
VAAPNKTLAPTVIARAILVLRGQRVLLDAELAALYGVTTKRLNEQVSRTPNASQRTSCSASRTPT